MNTSARSSKTARHTDTDAPGHDSQGDRGASLASRRSGIDFVDRASATSGQGLPAALRSGIESLSGCSMGHVSVHYNSSRPAELGTLAYAQGSEIHLAPGQERTLPHEAWHVVQQIQGRVSPTARAEDGRPVNDQMQLEREADAMGAKALPTIGGATARTTREVSAGGLSVAPPSAAGASAVIQCWPGLIDRWLQKRNGYAPMEDPDRPLVQESKAVGHQAQTAKKAVEARRRDKFAEGAVQVGTEGVKIGLDALGTATTGVPIGSVVGGVISMHSVASSGRQAYRETGQSKSVVKAVGKEVLKEGVREALGNIPVVGEFIGIVEGVATMGNAFLQSSASRLEDKQSALDNLVASSALIEEARERLAKPDLEADSRRRLEKAVNRYDAALATGRAWQKKKAEGGKLPLLTQEL